MATQPWPLRELVATTARLEAAEDLIVQAERNIAAAKAIVAANGTSWTKRIDEIDELTATELEQKYDVLRSELENVDSFAIAGARRTVEDLTSLLLSAEEAYVTFIAAARVDG